MIALLHGVLSNPAGGAGYSNTAFVSSAGDDGTAVLNDPDLPFETIQAALEELDATFATAAVTVRFLTDITETVTLPAGLSDNDKITFRRHDGTSRTVSGSITTSDVNLNLEFDGVTIATWTFAASSELFAKTGGDLKGLNGAVITNLNAKGLGVDGTAAAGFDGGSTTGNPGSAGSDGDPPGSGSDGDSVDETGGVGDSGTDGGFGWNVDIWDDLTVTNADLSGGYGQTGGTGGTGGTAQGGDGGPGGNAQNPMDPQDGAPGGNGGSATAHGGDGGSGGGGGNGGTLTRHNGAVCTNFTSDGGTGGGGGNGGAAGSATGGLGGAGGSGATGGNTGPEGSPGSANADVGNSGSNGAAGAAGSLV